MLYQKKYPDHPWLTEDAIKFLSSYLKKSDVGLEFGSGRSTLWFAKRISHLTSVETDSIWFDKVKQAVNCNGIHNVTLIYLEDTSCLPEARQTDSKDILKYNEIIKMFQPDSLEFVLVDGANRSFCANAAIEIVKNGGIIIIDNAEWFIPSDSVSPGAIKLSQPPYSLEWGKFLEKVKDYRCIRTTNGVWDTYIYIKLFKKKIWEAKTKIFPE